MQGRNALLFLTLGTLLLGRNAAAAEPVTIDPETLDYYLFQAFDSTDSSERTALYHIGVQGQQQENGFLIHAVLDAYPAHAAGLMRGDIILSSNGSKFHEVLSFNSPPNTQQDLKGSATEYALEILREGQSREFSVTPVFENLFDSYRSATASSTQQFNAGNKTIGYVHFWALSRTSHDVLTYHDLVQSLAQSDGIILDLRNSYGYLDTHQLQLFAARNLNFLVKDAAPWLQDWENPSFSVQIEPYRRPVAILVNRQTRAAGELMAAALSPLERIVTLGESTAGFLGSITKVSQASAMHYEASETLINGTSVESTGIQPEMVVEYLENDSRRDDPQFETAINFLLGII